MSTPGAESPGFTPKETRHLLASIQELLHICEENHVPISAQLKASLLAPRHVLEMHRDDDDDHDLTRPKSQQEVLTALSASARLNDPDEMMQQGTGDDDIPLLQDVRENVIRVQGHLPSFDLHIKDGSYTVTKYSEDHHHQHRSNKEGDNDNSNRRAKQKIQTIHNSSPIYKIYQILKKCIRGERLQARKEEKIIMQGANLVIEPGKQYLVLGAPGSGKSTLLKMISDNLHQSKNHMVGGKVSINGVSPSKDLAWSNLVGYIDQIDRLHPYLTVRETCEFAWKCRSGLTHRQPWFADTPEANELIDKMDKEMVLVNKVLEGLGLTRVQDTFVGDQSTVRGVSGGEKKRVTVAEMMCAGSPIVCGDEISTGLDAATTFDITRLCRAVCRMKNTAMLISLLQPAPETVANFDEMILVSEGRIIYAGRVDEVIDHFCSLGYNIPERMDVADWLQELATKDGWVYLAENTIEAQKDKIELTKNHLTSAEFMERFYASERGKQILATLANPPKSEDHDFIMDVVSQRYRSSHFDCLKLVVTRELLLWWRDKYAIKAKVGQSIAVGVVAGTMYWQSSDEVSIVGVLFQSMFYCVINAMLSVVNQFPARSMFYKQQNANFFPTWTYVVSRTASNLPGALIDAFVFGSIMFWFVGLSWNDGASIANYFLFVFLLVITSMTANAIFGIFPACLPDITTAQASMAVLTVILVLFSGFTVQANIIPDYYVWIYWINIFAWMLRALAVNEFDSGAYDSLVPEQTSTKGEIILTRFGFTLDGDPFTFEWAWYAVIFCVGVIIVAVLTQIRLFDTVRFSTGQSLVTDQGVEADNDITEAEQVALPFQRVDLTFQNIRYTVTSSITKESLELLKGVSGVLSAGKMTALMGSSGAGKTTLMDVLAMRKSSGEIEGEIKLNGHLQEEKTFRRCIGYVEQFDVQSSQLTIRETVDFSAKLRLDETDPHVTDDSVTKFVDQTLEMLELTNIQDLQVGSDAGGGLSFEQRKRLSIAVELVANPSILFLDEPTSGLDARAASIVMRGLKRIALSGRAVCATIHQPSIAIFNDFDYLLLLKRGGETVFFGELGNDSSKLIQYLEQYETTPRILPGENPATWMLTTIGAGSAQQSGKPFDYAGSYVGSSLFEKCTETIRNITAGATEENKVTFPSKYATSSKTQSLLVLKRSMIVYFRSPSYNLTRILVSAVVALLFSSVYASQRVPETESDMSSRINSIFIAVLFLCVSALNTVLAVFESERNMFYRHKASNMYDSRAILLGFTLAEVPFVFMASVVFSVTFYFIMGFAMEAGKFFYFLMFVFFALACFTFIGQMLVSLLRDATTAQVLGGLLINMTVMTSGILLRPDNIPDFWIFAYWVFPGHYIYEGIFTTQYDGDTTEIVATVGSPFFQARECNYVSTEPCVGTAEQWVQTNFTDFDVSHVGYCAGYLIALVFISRIITYFALTHLNYRET